MTLPASVPEIPAANVDKAAGYYVNNLGFTFDSRSEESGIAGMSRASCTSLPPPLWMATSSVPFSDFAQMNS